MNAETIGAIISFVICVIGAVLVLGAIAFWAVHTLIEDMNNDEADDDRSPE